MRSPGRSERVSGLCREPPTLCLGLIPSHPPGRPLQSHTDRPDVNESLTVYFCLKVFHISEHSYVTVVLTIRKSNSAKGKGGMSRLFFFFFFFFFLNFFFFCFCFFLHQSAVKYGTEGERIKPNNRKQQQQQQQQKNTKRNTLTRTHEIKPGTENELRLKPNFFFFPFLKK